MAEDLSSLIVRELANKDVDWYNLGFLLNAPKYRLDAINKEYRLYGDLRCLIELFNYFDISDCSPTLVQVTESLRIMERHEVADALAARTRGNEEQAGATSSRPDAPLVLTSSSLSSTGSEERSSVERIHSQDSEERPRYDILVDEQVSVKFKRLTFAFSNLLMDVRGVLESSVTQSVLIELQTIADQHLGLPPLPENDATLSSIFTRMGKEMSFLNYHLLELLIERFAYENKKLQRKFHRYERQYKKFEKTSQVRDLKDEIFLKFSSVERRRRHEVRLKLKDYWGRHTLQGFGKLMRNIVSGPGGNERRVGLTVTEGCVCVTWEVPLGPTGGALMEVLPLAVSSPFMSAVGVISFSVGGETVYSRPDSVDSLFLQNEHLCTTESEFVCAISSGQMEAACVLLAVSDDPTTMIKAVSKQLRSLHDSKKWSILHFASDRGYSDVVEAILTTGAVPSSTTDRNGWTPLMVAINSLHIDTAKLLINSSSSSDDVNAQSTSGGTALLVATQTGQSVIVNDLLKAGANPSTANEKGATPLMAAAQRGLTDIVSSLIKRQDAIYLNARNKKGETALAIASDNGHDKVVSLLVEGGADLGVADTKDYTPLMKACTKGFSPVVDIIAGRVDVNVGDRNGLTPLHLASQHGYTILVSKLLSLGANPQAKLKGSGLTPVLAASDKGHSAVVTEILRQSDPNTVPALVQGTTSDGKTALYYASRSGSVGCTLALLEHGADPNVADKDGSTPLMIASYKGFKEIVKRLLKDRARLNTEHKSKTGSTALYLAVDKGHKEVVDLLLRHGARPNIHVSSTGWTPLIQASAKGHTHIVTLLIEHMAKVNEQAVDGSTALHMAALYGHKDIAEALVDNNASFDLKNRKGETAYDVAVRKHHLNIARLLNMSSADTGYGTLSTTSTTVSNNTVSTDNDLSPDDSDDDATTTV